MTESDAEIIQQALRGDPLAWEQLVVAHTRRIYNLCYRFVGRADQAEDLTQEVFIKVFRNLNQYHPESGNFVTWLMSVTRNLLIDHYRQSKADRMTVSTDENEEFSILDVTPAQTSNPQDTLEREEKGVILQRALRMLPPQLREAVVLRDLEELTYQEIGEILKVPEGTVKSRINRGRLELAKSLQKLRFRERGFAV